jgi:hypothetical protein
MASGGRLWNGRVFVVVHGDVLLGDNALHGRVMLPLSILCHCYLLLPQGNEKTSIHHAPIRS